MDASGFGNMKGKRWKEAHVLKRSAPVGFAFGE